MRSRRQKARGPSGSSLLHDRRHHGASSTANLQLWAVTRLLHGRHELGALLAEARTEQHRRHRSRCRQIAAIQFLVRSRSDIEGSQGVQKANNMGVLFGKQLQAYLAYTIHGRKPVQPETQSATPKHTRKEPRRDQPAMKTTRPGSAPCPA